jgi:5-methylcytosine-specific restriction endonuclease McrA
MKRTPLTRKPTRLKRGRPSDELKEKMLQFKWSVSGQACAGCGRFSYAHAHHVVYRQFVPVELAWDERNAMPACVVGNNCHGNHHSAARRLPLSALTDANWEFAREVLGDSAEDWLRRRYADDVP